MATAKLYNLARMTTATTGTGTLTLGSAATGFISFATAGVSDGETITYAIEDGNDREIGRGTYTASGTTLTRSVLKSTNAGSAINLSGTAQVFITNAAEDHIAGPSASVDSEIALFSGTGGDTLKRASTTGILKGASGVLSAASAGTDYVAPGGALGTPSSGTLTNCSGLPASGLVASTSQAVGFGTIELGHASDTTLSRSSAGVMAVEGVTVAMNSTSATHTAGTIELGAASDTTLARSAAGTVTVEGVQVLLAGQTAALSKGFTVSAYSGGTVSSGTFTVDATNNNVQYYTNGGAHTFAAPSSDCEVDVLVTNNGSAGAITFSGFTVGSSTGSALTTTNTNKFIISVKRINGTSTYSVYALQ